MAKERLRDRLPEGALDAYDETAGRTDARLALTRAYSRSTLRNYRYRFDNYKRWCVAKGYQPDILHISDARAEEYVTDQTLPPDRYHPETIKQSINALRYYAERAGISTMPSFRDAYARLHVYMAELAGVSKATSPVSPGAL